MQIDVTNFKQITIGSVVSGTISGDISGTLEAGQHDIANDTMISCGGNYANYDIRDITLN